MIVTGLFVAVLVSTVRSLPSCNLQLSPDVTVWVNNSTREIQFPLSEEKCPQCSNPWEGNVEMQSGDVLIVTVNTTRMGSPATPSTTPIPSSTTDDILSSSPSSPFQTTLDSSSPSSPASPSTAQVQWSTESPSMSPPASVFLAPRAGTSDPCDVSDAVQLDASIAYTAPTATVTLYDKDLNEGVNLIIIMVESGSCVKMKIVVKSENCGDGGDCSSKGACFTNASMEGFECQCCPGYIGPHCEERDACFPSPCLNNGICVDISQGHEGSTFQCLCPYGFTGKVCEDSGDPCESGPCQHGGACLPNNETAQQFKCSCPPGYAGPLCQHNVDACASSPCHHGICVDNKDGFRCFCQPGFSGSLCEDEYNECVSSPCLNGGTCLDHIDSYSCTCGRGYTGARCHVKVDLCEPNPCSHHHYCVDKGNTYVCECPRGFTGPECLIPTRAICSANPCKNGGTCWSSVDSFYCACRPGFTGKSCEEEVVVEVIPSSGDPMDAGDDQPIDLQMPVAIHLDHLHNVYVAAGTLACALLIVIVTVVICHCRMHETYKHCCFKKSPLLLPCHISRLDAVLKKNSLDKDKEPLASTPRQFPVLDNSDVYYTLDFSDSQSSPLIQ